MRTLTDEINALADFIEEDNEKLAVKVQQFEDAVHQFSSEVDIYIEMLKRVREGLPIDVKEVTA